MSDQGDSVALNPHVVLKCSSTSCGMRYPSPADDPRRGFCPLCEAPVDQVAVFDVPPVHDPAPRPADAGRLVGLLDNIRSALNVGTMLRSADGAAFDHVYLGGLTAAPDNPKVIKTALGAEQSVASTSCLDLTTCIAELQAQRYEIWALDQTADSVALQSLTARPCRVAIVVGNERAGVDPAILALADRHVHLDMLGTKSTLNVAVAFGAAAYCVRSLPVVATTSDGI